MKLGKIMKLCAVTYDEDGTIYKDGKWLSRVEFHREATAEAKSYAVLAEHFRLMAKVANFPAYKANGMRKLYAVSYWCNVGDNFDKFLVVAELLEHCLANSCVWRGYDAFNFGGELSGYSDDIVHEAIQRGDRFMTFGTDFDRAAMWAKAHGYDQLSKALQNVQDTVHICTNAEMVKAHDTLVDAFWEIFKEHATREDKRQAMEYAFDM